MAILCLSMVWLLLLWERSHAPFAGTSSIGSWIDPRGRSGWGTLTVSKTIEPWSNGRFVRKMAVKCCLSEGVSRAENQSFHPVGSPESWPARPVGSGLDPMPHPLLDSISLVNAAPSPTRGSGLFGIDDQDVVGLAVHIRRRTEKNGRHGNEHNGWYNICSPNRVSRCLQVHLNPS
jgi:hypothetical protein